VDKNWDNTNTADKMTMRKVPESWAFWRLESDRGRQVWVYDGPQPDWSTEEGKQFLQDMEADFSWDKEANPNSADRLYRYAKTKDFAALPKKDTTDLNQEVEDSLRRGFAFYQQLQEPDGHWPGDYGGPMFLLPGLVIASFFTQSPFDEPYRSLMRRYMLNHQNEDGGWGLHIESPSTMFGTAMQYVALRILGLSAESPEAEKARKWMHQHGGAIGIPSWGKFYLSLLGVYEWEGNHSLFPEMWLMPKALPVHPSRYWCHCRMVYLPMAYCYGYKLRPKESQLLDDLREELYVQDYASIDWVKARDIVAKPDQYTQPGSLLSVLNKVTNTYEKMVIKGWRQKSLDFVLSYIDAEDKQTNYIDIGPVNQVINSICVYHAYGADSEQFQKHRERWKDYLWLAEDGMKMNGYNGSQLWDTAFAAQAFAESGLAEDFRPAMEKAYDYFDKSQILNEVEDRKKYFRHIQVGGWPFSTLDHGWPITDCTAEGMKGSMALEDVGIFPGSKPAVDRDRFEKAVNVILSYQNEDGGWATYENKRGPNWLEKINPSEIFGEIMVDYSYVECSSACMQALAKFAKRYPDHRKEEIDRSLKRGAEFLLKEQKSDGSWFGSWAVCFTYGTWFGIEGMIAAGAKTYREGNPDPSIQKACEYLASKQNKDGSWGESFESCFKLEYVPHDEGQIVNTAWALMSLLQAGYPDDKAIEKGVRFLLSMQEETGDWPQQAISGVFNKTCMITYTSYRNVFVLWALGRYNKTMRG
jgi:lanosterol synthase